MSRKKHIVSFDAQEVLVTSMHDTAEGMGAALRIMLADIYSSGPHSDAGNAQLLGLSLWRWRKIRPAVEGLIERLRPDWNIEVQFRREALSQETKRAVYERDGLRCSYCGTHEGGFHIDHVIPVAKGGGNGLSNLCVACEVCNLSKAGKTLAEWRP